VFPRVSLRTSRLTAARSARSLKPRAGIEHATIVRQLRNVAKPVIGWTKVTTLSSATLARMQRPNTENIIQRLKGETTNKLEAAALDFTARLKRDFLQDIACNPRDFKNQVLRLVRRTLPPRRGRPNDPCIDAALRMVERGNSVKEVLRSQIADFEKLDAYGRYLAEKGLRAAIARRRGRDTKCQISRSVTTT
jgi:hypothetical protein